MRRLIRSVCIGYLTVALVACSNTTRQPDRAGVVCTESLARAQDPGLIVAVNMENNPELPPFADAYVYAPHGITAAVGQVIVFTNRDQDTQHTAELDSGACGTDYLDPNKSDSLVFTAPGTYPIHCLVQGKAMSGTITIVR